MERFEKERVAENQSDAAADAEIDILAE